VIWAPVVGRNRADEFLRRGHTDKRCGRMDISDGSGRHGPMPLLRPLSSTVTRTQLRGHVGRSNSEDCSQRRSGRPVAQRQRSAPITLGWVIAYSVRRGMRLHVRHGDLPSAALSWTCRGEPRTSRRNLYPAMIRKAFGAGRGRALHRTRCGIHIRPSETSPCRTHRELQRAHFGVPLQARSVVLIQPLCRPTMLQVTA
jgi:hypothetical protein